MLVEGFSHCTTPRQKINIEYNHKDGPELYDHSALDGWRKAAYISDISV